MSDPLGLTEEGRQRFGEYVIYQQSKGRTSIPMSELEVVIDVLKLSYAADPDAHIKG